MSSRYFTETDAENLRLLEDAVSRIKIKAGNENRSLTADESEMVKKLTDAIYDLKKIPHRPETMPMNMSLGGNSQSIRTGGPYELRSPKDPKDYRTLFGDDGYKWPDRNTNFFSAVFSGRHHEGLITRSMTETVPSDGGFLVPGETAARIHNVSLESEIVQPRAFVQPMRSNSIKIPAMSISSHAVSLMGGFTASYTNEAGTINEANPKTRSMELQAKKLTGLIRFSSELSADVPGE